MPKQPTLNVELVPVSDLIPYINNAKLHPEEQIGKIAASIQEFGFNDPIAIDGENGVIEGHGRLLAAIKLKLPKVPVIKLDHLTKTQKKAYILAHNKLTMDSGFDDALLKLEMEGLGDDGFDLSLTGFDEDEIQALLDDLEGGVSKAQGDPDDVPEVPEQPFTMPGDLYQIGPHRLLCGDSMTLANIERLINGQRVDMVFTDPPYGIDVAKTGMVGGCFGISKKGNYKPVIGDETTRTAEEFFKICKLAGFKHFIIWGGNYFSSFLPPSNSWVVWNKRGDTGIKNTFADAELAWSNIGFPVRVHNQLWNGMVRQGEHEKRVHPTQKPIALASFCFDLLGKNQIVFDGFGGSGSTMVAAHQTNRRALLIEIDPHYCDIIIARMKKLFPDLPVTRNGEPI